MKDTECALQNHIKYQVSKKIYVAENLCRK